MSLLLAPLTLQDFFTIGKEHLGKEAFYPAGFRAACDCSFSSYKKTLERLEWEGMTQSIPALP